MSLWYESLAECLYDCGDDSREKAACILSYLSMPVPRSWWERALFSGRVDDTHASVLLALRNDLMKMMGPGRAISSELLVALAFTEPVLAGRRKTGNTAEAYLEMAGKVLAQQPALARIGRMIDHKGQTGRRAR